MIISVNEYLFSENVFLKYFFGIFKSKFVKFIWKCFSNLMVVFKTSNHFENAIPIYTQNFRYWIFKVSFLQFSHELPGDQNLRKWFSRKPSSITCTLKLDLKYNFDFLSCSKSKFSLIHLNMLRVLKITNCQFL